jgi:uncharacterized protein
MEKKLAITVSKTIGKISALITDAKKPKAMMVLAHGAGAGMEHPFMKSMSAELAACGISTVRYNFPYMENKKGRPDPPAIAEKTVEEVASKVQALYPKLPLFLSGKSFGGRMSSQRLSKEGMEGIRGIIFFGFPLHASGAPSIDRAAHLSTVKVPMLFLQGTRDTLAQLDLIQSVVKKLPLATLVTFEKADHSFKAGKENLLPKLATMTSEWIDQVLKK